MKTMEELEQLQKQYLTQYEFHKRIADDFHKKAVEVGHKIIDRIMHPEVYKE